MVSNQSITLGPWLLSLGWLQNSNFFFLIKKKGGHFAIQNKPVAPSSPILGLGFWGRKWVGSSLELGAWWTLTELPCFGKSPKWCDSKPLGWMWIQDSWSWSMAGGKLYLNCIQAISQEVSLLHLQLISPPPPSLTEVVTSPSTLHPHILTLLHLPSPLVLDSIHEWNSTHIFPPSSRHKWKTHSTSNSSEMLPPIT